MTTTAARPYDAPHYYTRRDIDDLPQLQAMNADERLAMKAVSAVLPFRVNQYVVENLIDWDAVPDDPIFRLTFPHRDMLAAHGFDSMVELVSRDAPAEELRAVAETIQRSLNPHPSGQLNLNPPRDESGQPMAGMQHKYRETVVFFPAAGQTCHSYCQYCFRWPQFVGLHDLRFAAKEAAQLVGYLQRHPEVTSVLFTGGDPMVMSAKKLRSYVEPLIAPGAAPHVQSIRIGTKSPAYWPYRYTTDEDADDVLRLFEEVVASGRSLALVVHYSHPRELSTDVARDALRRIRRTGAAVYAQAPLIRHVNDDPAVWSELWATEISLGAHPYYMFVERDTGARDYFEVPLVEAFRIFTEAYRTVTGLGRTVRGPVMSCMPGKVLVDDVTEINGEPVLILNFLQGRNPEWVNRTFLARRDDNATWFDHLQPAGDQPWFFAEELQRMIDTQRPRPWLPDGA